MLRNPTILIVADLLAVALVLAVGQPVSAAPFSFDNGAATGVWETGTNWSPDNPTGLPNIQGGNDYTVGGAFSTTSAGSTEVGNGGAAGAGTLNVATSGTVSFGGIFLLSRDRDSQTTQTSGTLHSDTGLLLGNGTGAQTSAFNARYDMDGGTLSTDGFTFLADRSVTMVFDQTAGSATFGNGDQYFSMSPSTAQGGNSTYQISGGSLLVNTDAFGIGGGSGGDLNQDGGTALFEVIGTGPSSVTTNAPVKLFDGGTLKFTMGAGGVTPMTANDSVELLGDLEVDLTGLLGGGDFDVGDITLIDKISGGAIGGAFANFAEGDNVGGTYFLTYQGGTGNDLVLFSDGPPLQIPEPASIAVWSILALGLTSFGVCRARRQKRS